MPAELRGAIVPLVTPFATDESIDSAALSRLVEHAIANGAQGLMPTALSGEGPPLDAEETLAVLKAGDGDPLRALGEHLHALPGLESRTEAELG